MQDERDEHTHLSVSSNLSKQGDVGVTHKGVEIIAQASWRTSAIIFKLGGKYALYTVLWDAHIKDRGGLWEDKAGLFNIILCLNSSKQATVSIQSSCLCFLKL